MSDQVNIDVTRTGYRPDWWPCHDDDTSPYNVLKICQDLHESNTGSSEPFCEETRKLMVRSLEWLIENWQPSKCTFDDCARDLVCATLAEEYRLRNEEYRSKSVFGWDDFNLVSDLNGKPILVYGPRITEDDIGWDLMEVKKNLQVGTVAEEEFKWEGSDGT